MTEGKRENKLEFFVHHRITPEGNTDLNKKKRHGFVNRHSPKEEEVTYIFGGKNLLFTLIVKNFYKKKGFVPIYKYIYIETFF